MKLKYYIESFRLRTLPLSASGILLGSFYAISDGVNRPFVFLLALLTTVSLQILSNISNEVGDMEKGTDNAERLGPIRSIQRGVLRKHNLKQAMLFFAFLSAIFGTILVALAFGTLFCGKALGMLLLGMLAIWASVKYTFGKNAYGYIGLGDVFVFLFFGLVSTLGTYYVAVGSIRWSLLLPASAVGMLSTGVLNVNNMRDIKNDSACNKKTMAVRMGLGIVKLYHYFLIIGAVLLMFLYNYLLSLTAINYLFLLILPAFVFHLTHIKKHSDRELDSQLKILSISTLAFCLLVGIGSVL